MCVTCLVNNQHTHNNHNYSSAPLHNLNKKIHTDINTQFQYGNHRHVCMHATDILISHNLCCIKILQLRFSDDRF
jgi:hypothetical protein